MGTAHSWLNTRPFSAGVRVVNVPNASPLLVSGGNRRLHLQEEKTMRTLGNCGRTGIATLCLAVLGTIGTASAQSTSAQAEAMSCGNRADLAQLSHGKWATVQDGINGPSYRGVWGSGPRDVWIVGSRQNGQHADALLIHHFDGDTWQDGAGMLDPQGILPPLNAVWGSDAVHVWAVGEEGTVLFWDGVAWMPLLTGATNALFSVWGSGPNDVWIGGTDGVRHFNGISWTPVGTITGVNALWLSPE